MIYYSYIVLFCLLISFVGCSSSSDDVVWKKVEQPAKIQEGAYADECRWIYEQMNHYYLWRSEMPDSMACDYATDPVSFFKSLLSSKDRFSYCERNEEFTGNAEVVKDNGDDFVYAPLSRSSTSSVLFQNIYTAGHKRVGYMCYLEFRTVSEVSVVMKKFKTEGVDELIIDLRYNPGGYVSVCKYLCNCIVDETGYGNVFQYKAYNNILTSELLKTTGIDKEADMYDYPPESLDHILGTPVYSLNMKRVFVLTSKRTASASEALIICLKPYMDVVVIGDQTVGKGVGSFTMRNPRCKYELHPITMRYYNQAMQTTPDEGLVPDYIVPNGDETSQQNIGNTEEPLLKTALALID